MTSLIVPTDFSEPAAFALRSATRIAKESGADLLLLHVVEDLAFPPCAWAAPPPAERQVVEEATERQTRDELDRIAQDVRDVGIEVATEIRHGLAAEEIVAQPTARGDAMIIMSTRGRSRFAQSLLGSVANKVARLSRSPVLTLKAPSEEGADGWRMPRLGRILCPVDLSDPSIAAVRTASQWAQGYEATVDFVHIIEDPALHPLRHWKDFPATLEEYARAAAPGAKKALEDLVITAVSERPPGECIVRSGHPSEQLQLMCDRGHHDLVIMSTHGHGGLRHAILGSVTEGMIRRAPCPVLTVRPGEQQ